MYETSFGQNICWFKHSGSSLNPPATTLLRTSCSGVEIVANTVLPSFLGLLLTNAMNFLTVTIIAKTQPS